MKITGFKTSGKNRLISIFSNMIIAAVIIFVGAVSIFVIPSVTAGSFDEGEIYHRGNTSKKQVSLCFSVYWGNENLLPMINILKAKNIPATFFVGGSWADDSKLILETISSSFEIGNHGYYQKDHSKLNLAQNQDELYLNHTLINNLVNQQMSLFCPPSGKYNQATLQATKNLGYTTIIPGTNTLDKSRSEMLNLITKNIRNGEIIILYPNMVTLDALEEIVIRIQSRGYNFVTVSQNIL